MEKIATFENFHLPNLEKMTRRHCQIVLNFTLFEPWICAIREKLKNDPPLKKKPSSHTVGNLKHFKSHNLRMEKIATFENFHLPNLEKMTRRLCQILPIADIKSIESIEYIYNFHL
jgi:hypothetical protein